MKVVTTANVVEGLAMQTQEPEKLGWTMTGNADEIAHILTDFANDLRRGDLTVWRKESTLHIDTTGNIRVSVQAGHDGNHDGMTIKLDWSKE